MTGEIETRVDELLLEQGEYVPMELLLQEARLEYADYEAWRHGDIDRLEEALFGDPQQVCDLLRHAAEYLERRGWQPVDTPYTRWGRGGADDAGSALRFSTSDALDDLFRRSYRKPEDLPQMDLFTDSPATALCNSIIEAVLNKDIVAARRRLDRLTDTAPSDNRLGDLDLLTDALEELEQTPADVSQALSQLQRMLVPAVERLLGTAASRQYLVPHWRRLSRALEKTPFRNETPWLHASYTAAQALDWTGVRDAIEHEQHWRSYPILLQRHAEACDRQRDPAGWWSWFTLLWWHPGNEDALDNSHPELRQLWEAFQTIEPEMPVRSLPSWALLQRPGLAHLADNPRCNMDEAPADFATLLALISLRRQSADGGPREMTLRAQLQGQNAELLRHFLMAAGNMAMGKQATAPRHA